MYKNLNNNRNNSNRDQNCLERLRNKSADAVANRANDALNKGRTLSGDGNDYLVLDYSFFNLSIRFDKIEQLSKGRGCGEANNIYCSTDCSLFCRSSIL